MVYKYMIYNHLHKIILRTPFFPMEDIRRLASKADLDENALKEVCKNPAIQEALYLASPVFYREAMKWMEGRLPNRKEEEKAMQGVYRYFARMCTRCTPFGLFAGITTGNIGERTEIEMSAHEKDNLHIRLDMNYVCALAKDLSGLNAVKERLRFFPNTSLYAMGERLRYVEYNFKKAKRSHHIAAVENTPYLQNVLTAARQGKRMDELAALLVDDEITHEEALAFVGELVESQLLVSELEPTVSGGDPLGQIIKVLDAIGDEEVKGMASALEAINDRLSTMRSPKAFRPVSDYSDIKKRLASFPTQFEEKFLFQGDLLQHTERCRVSRQLVEDVFRTVAFLNRVSPAFENENLTSFREAFYARYEDEEVPLAVALDAESGIGYLQNAYNGITPLVDDIMFPMRQQNHISSRTLPFQVLLQQKFAEAIKTGQTEIALSDLDLEGFEGERWEDTQETISAFIQVLEDERFVFKSAGGSCAANLIGRFAHLDKSLLEHTRQIVAKDEADEDKIYAEIVHLPESRTGNILHRPTIREYEIPYLAHSSVPADQQIGIEDLMVSVRGGKILLHSKRHNKEVVPRLTTAHNYSMNALPIYHFLCDLQNQGKRGGFGFSWGVLENTQVYLPRVTYGKAILSLATWNFFTKDIKKLNDAKGKEERIDCFMEMAEQRGIVDEVVLEDSDNELYLNLKNRFCVGLLLDLVKRRPVFVLKEFTFAIADSPAISDGATRANEILIAYHKNHENTNA